MLEMGLTGILAGVLPFSRNICKVAVYAVPCTKEGSLNPYLFALYETLSIDFSGLLIR